MTPEQIAAGLSEALQEHIRLADDGDAYCIHFSALYHDDATFKLVDGYPAHNDPACHPDDDHGTRWYFTPLGQQVAKILKEM